MSEKKEFIKDFVSGHTDMPPEIRKERAAFYKILGGQSVDFPENTKVRLYWKSTPHHYNVMCAVIDNYSKDLSAQDKLTAKVMNGIISDLYSAFKNRPVVKVADGLVHVTVDCTMIHINVLTSLMLEVWSGRVKDASRVSPIVDQKEFESDVVRNFFLRVKGR